MLTTRSTSLVSLAGLTLARECSPVIATLCNMKEVETIQQLEELIGFSLSRYYPEKFYEHKSVWLSMVLTSLTKSIKSADPLAIEDACKIILLDPHMPFGKISKSNFARALKKYPQYISSEQKQDIINVTASILSLEFCPREAEDYCKLVRKFGENAVKEVISKSNPSCCRSNELISNLEEHVT